MQLEILCLFYHKQKLCIIPLPLCAYNRGIVVDVLYKRREIDSILKFYFLFF